VLWSRLKNRQLEGIKFRRQVQVGRFYFDFISQEINLAIELDGGQHTEDPVTARDQEKQQRLAEDGYLLLRFWNDEVLNNLEGVLSRIAEVAATLTLSSPHPLPSDRAGGN
jgi:very-short-patch-repair endonuclease